MSFQYVTRASQLCYSDPSTGRVIPLPCWISTSSDLSLAVSSIRARRWGSIPVENFVLRTWNDSSAGVSDGTVAVDSPVFYSPDSSSAIISVNDTNTGAETPVYSG